MNFQDFISPNNLFGEYGFLKLGLLAVWTLIWKGIALWKSAGRREKGWFVVLLIVNTVGILEILYIFLFSKKARRQPLGTEPREIKAE